MNKFCPRYSHEKRPVIFQYRSSDLIQQSILTQLAYNRGHYTYTVTTTHQLREEIADENRFTESTLGFTNFQEKVTYPFHDS
jgi:hypothetical protein